MPRGGARVGAGQKPKHGKPAPFVPGLIDGGRSGDVSERPPDDLPEAHQAFWRTYAGSAIALGTLTPQTVGSFRLLCELESEKAATLKTIDRDGRTYIKCVVDGAGNEHQELKAHPLTSAYRQLAKQVDALMARFMLAPFGKPAPGAKPKKAQGAPNPWARIVDAG